MKVAIIKKPSIHAIPLILLAMLVLYSTSSFATNPQKSSTSYKPSSKSAHFITLAKGQAYVPPQKKSKCSNNG